MPWAAASSTKNVTVLGAAFKPFSDDVRDSPALDVAVRLYGLGAKVVVTDPQAIENARRVHPQLDYITDRDEAIRDADAIVLVTEWDEYRRELAPDTHRHSRQAGSSSTAATVWMPRLGGPPDGRTTAWDGRRGRSPSATTPIETQGEESLVHLVDNGPRRASRRYGRDRRPRAPRGDDERRR